MKKGISVVVHPAEGTNSIRNLAVCSRVCSLEVTHKLYACENNQPLSAKNNQSFKSKLRIIQEKIAQLFWKAQVGVNSVWLEVEFSGN